MVVVVVQGSAAHRDVYVQQLQVLAMLFGTVHVALGKPQHHYFLEVEHRTVDHLILQSPWEAVEALAAEAESRILHPLGAR